ncbi:MAG: hypothetical protein NTX97_15490 [Bacteroidetes bacterium]|nr:hypothetical protein [Bacteroidota bacterium]
MNASIRIILFFLFLFVSCLSFSQKDTSRVRGTIKIAKVKEGEVYIKVSSNFEGYDLTKIPLSIMEKGVSKEDMFQPFPVVEGYPFPFNYTNYLMDCFKTKEINLKGKSADTVVLSVKILANGKSYFKDKSKILMVNGIPAVYDKKQDAYEINNLHLNCINFMKKIDKWLPGYIVFPKKGKFKGEVVIKPYKRNVDVSGTITIMFSTTPFED